ncbi:hypothetical protein [Oceaniferula marina]|nr:hypothetical protein [Oceaniferula marina]
MDAAELGWLDRMGAMTVKELRQGLRRGMFIFPFIFIQLLAVMATAFEFHLGDVERYSEKTGVFNLALVMDSGPFWMVAWAVCVVVMPLGGLLLMGQELEEGNHELLQMTGLNRWRVVRGKFLVIWGCCILTFLSLLPYLIVRYFIGGIDPWRNIILSLSLVFAAGLTSAGTLGASAFKGVSGKLGVMALYACSLLISGSMVLWASAFRSGGCGWIYHINALFLFVCYLLLGLGLARSRIRLVVHHYEVKPSWMVMGLLFFSPLVVGMSTAMTVGYGGFIGLIGISVLAWFTDISPKAPSWVSPTGALPQSGGLLAPVPLPTAPNAGGDTTPPEQEPE